jgi:hypothetical protein
MYIQCSADSARKKVRFAAEEDNSVLVFASEEAETPLWLGPGFYKALRKSVREEADQLKPKGYGVLLKRCFDPGPDVQKQINALAQLPGSECPRGSEQYLSRQHAEECDSVKDKVRGAVLTRQRLLVKKEIPADVVSEKLRSVSRKHSRSSRVFARRLGIADERAVKDGDDAEKARILVKSLNLGNARVVRRQNSLKKDIADPTGDQGVARMLGVSFKLASSKFNETHRAERPLLSPEPNSSAACAHMIQSALDLLEMDGDDEAFSQPYGVATSASA